MTILSICRKLKPCCLKYHEVIHIAEYELSAVNFTSSYYGAVLVDHTGTLNFLRNNFNFNLPRLIPVIMLLARQASYEEIRKSLGSGATDFCVEPFDDLDEVIALNFGRADNLRRYVEGRFHLLRKSLASIIPHEFNTPLTAIMGLSSILAKEPITDPAMVKECGMNIRKSAKNLKNHVDNLVYYSYLQLKLSSNCEVCFARTLVLTNPEEIIQLVVLKLEYEFRRKIKCRIERAAIHCNETNFYKLIFNLLDNALKFSKKNEVVILESERLAGEYYIAIYNEGSGFNQEQMCLIGAFTQFDRDIHEQQGIGMGMAIVFSLLKLYNGRMNIISEKDKYTKIEIILKIAEVNRHQEEIHGQ